MAMFAELDPDPLIRIDPDGIIIKTNDAAKRFFENPVTENTNINKILPGIDFSIYDFVYGDKSEIIYNKIGERYYSISIKGISYLHIAQLYFNDLTDRIKFEKELKLSQEQLKELINYEQNMIEDERKRLAMELHDGIGQDLVVMKMSASNALEKAKNNEDIQYYKKLLNSLDNTINNLKGVLYDLKPRVLEELGLEAAIKTMSKKITAESGITSQVNFSGLNERLDEKQETTIYRIVQEALNNIVKHSGAKEYDINLFSRDGKIKIIISDDGTGFETEGNNFSTSGFGLRGIKERVENNQGTFNIESSKDSGTEIMVELPKREKQNEK